ncbi:uncharacterized protein LOC108740777 [Agrilus planipennis]|uniref:Uncharacterized protein LOC108740777 n=1 Tax=Agrilus planipennis TaxID=224129 RepID=A0A7F5RIF4_AGRPL|nr:uncharacterized protein LOC108740777 [Agrilus planipennis]
MESTSENAAIASEQRIVLDENSWPHNVTDPTVHPDQTNKSNEDSNTSNTNDVFVPEKLTTVEYIERGDIKEFVYTKYEERDKNEFDRLYLRRSWAPVRPKSDIDEPKRFTIAHDTIGRDQTDTCKEQTSPVRRGAIESLKQILESEAEQAKPSTNEKNLNNLEDNASNYKNPTKLSPEIVEKLKTKYSPSSYGYPKLAPLTSPGLTTKIPVLFNSKPIPQPRSPQSPKQEVNSTDYNNNNNKPEKELDKSKPSPNPKPRYLLEKQKIVVTNIEKRPVNETTKSRSKDSLDSDFPSDVSASDAKRHHVYLCPKRKIPIINSAIIIKDPPTKEEESTESEEEERVVIVRHSSSEDSVDKVDGILSQFVMDKKATEKKRSNSFRRLFKGTFFGRDKKKDEDKDKNSRKLNDQTDASVENSKNSFVRHSVHRHTVDGSYKTENLLNGCDNLGIKSNSDNANYKRSNHKRHNGRSKSYIADGDNSKGRSILNDYLPMDTGNKDKSENKTETYINVPNINKYIDASSSSSDSHNNTYENSLIAQAELRQAQELGRKQRNVKSGIPVPSNGKVGQTLRNQNDSPQHFTETPPRAQETYQNVQLIKPKALIPINSERPLPNPYRHKKPTASQSESMSETSKDENQEVLRNNLNLEIKSYVSKSYSSEASPQSPVSPNRENPYLNDIYGEPRDTLNRKEKQSKQELVKPAVPVRNSSLERQSDNQQSSSPGNQSVKSSPVIKPKPVNVPLEVKISPVSSKLSDSPLSPRSRDSYVGVRGSPISRNLKSPVSPLTLERTKLKLPSNREKVELQPRVKSPIPKTKVSTDKIIATELLRNSKEHSEQKQSEQRTIPDGERSKLVITRANSSTKTAVTSPTKLPRPPAQRNILQEMQVDSREAKQNDTSNSQSRHPSNYLINKSQQIPQQLPVTPQSQINVQPISSSTPKLLNYQAVRQLSPKEPVYQYSNGIVPLRQPMLHSPQQPNQYSQSNGQSLSPAQFQYLRQNIYVNTKVPEKVSPKLTPEELEERRWRNMEANKNMSLMSLHNSNSSVDPQRASISNFSMSSSNISPRTRSSLPPESSQPRSPQKQQMLQNVEAFYWRELKKMKEKEELDFLNYRRLYGYVEDPVVFHRSRSSTPSNLHNSRRSLSLPREVKSTSLSCPPDSNINYETINRNDRIQEHVQYIPVQNYPQQKINIATYPAEVQPGRVQNQNFVRRSSGRNTIGPIGSTASIQTIYENYPAGVAPTLLKRQQLQNPIFRRGSLVSNPSPLPNYPVHNQYKKVSFGSQGGNTSPAWPTKNGYTQSPPQRRLERQESLDDDVFLPNSPRIIKRSERATSEPVYGSRFPNESPSNVVYGQVQQQTVAVVAESPYGHAIPKQITVTNKVCDIYGQIHDNGEKVLMSPENYGQVKQTGIIYGTLQPNVGSRLSLASRQSNSNLSEYDAGNFVRGTRLTASVNDMYRRYSDRQRLNGNDQQRYINETMRNENMSNVHAEAPTRPLPPLPPSRRSRSDQLRKAVLRGNPPASDNESSGSEAGEIQRILQTDPRNNRINAIEEEWSSDGKQGRGTSGGESGGQRNENDVSDLKGGSSRSSRAARREDPRRHTLGGAGDQRYHSGMSQGGPLSRTMDLEGQLSRGYNPHSNAMLFDDDPGIMSEVETSSTGFRRGGKQRSSLPVVRTPSKTLERPLGLVFLQYRNETKRALLPNEITSIDTVKALFVRSFPKQLSMEYLDSPLVKIYIHDSSKDMFYELEDVRSHLREIRDAEIFMCTSIL